ncbi:uncharacterized protein LOC127125602 isoform X1 [Lathyrus oleraceus]|uniref:uncharacterized protein LOC127125602 isoform X1 n=1 Tax=Pisum sativum TaxID=3888 RepID=UPI0021D275D5|nr:uncharacterized protein LOC127125602 isoform X1 [Pisum sativum]
MDDEEMLKNELERKIRVIQKKRGEKKNPAQTAIQSCIYILNSLVLAPGLAYFQKLLAAAFVGLLCAVAVYFTACSLQRLSLEAHVDLFQMMAACGIARCGMR